MSSQLNCLFFLSLFAILGFSSTQHECQVQKCSHYGPNIKFPFTLKGRHQQHSGYPGFELSCNRNNYTILELPISEKARMKYSDLPVSFQYLVDEINYEYQWINIFTIFSPGLLPLLNISATPYDFLYGYDISLFNCSTWNEDYSEKLLPLPNLSSPDYSVYAFESSSSIFEFTGLLSCIKMFDTTTQGDSSTILFPITEVDVIPLKGKLDLLAPLKWSVPPCRPCEAKSKKCKLKCEHSILSAECYGGESDVSPMPERRTDADDPVKGALWKLRVAGEVIGPSLALLLALLLAIVPYRIYTKKWKEESEMKMKQFLVDYKALKPTRYLYADIKKITENFSKKLGEGGYGSVYKGKLSKDVFVAVKLLNNSKGDGQEFINEVSTMGRIHHVNVVRLVGYCADGFRRALVYEFMPNDSLQRFISSEKQRSKLGWEKLHRIAVDIAKGIEYLHQGCEQRILHFDIKPNNILLDHRFNPKISDFGLAKLFSKEQSIVSMTAARGTIGYIAPEVFSRNFGNVSYKSDVYSFGMLLLEMVGGLNKNDVGRQDKSEVYFPEWIYNKLEQGEDIAIQIEKESDDKIVKKLMIVGLWCIQWYPSERPSMKVVIQMLESEETPSMPRNPFTSTDGTNSRKHSHGRMFNNELEVISESE